MYDSRSVGDLIEKDEEMAYLLHSVHEACGWIFAVLLTLHIAGVVKHRFFDKSEADVLPGMI